MGNGVLIFGATSRIAEFVARRFAEEGKALTLVARSREKLDVLEGDLTARGASAVSTFQVDLGDVSQVEKFLNEQQNFEDDIETVVIAHGFLPDQEAIQNNWDEVASAYEVNLLTPLLIATRVATWFEKQGRGTLAVITSVAGDRGRKSNYVYGAAKGGLSLYLQGIRNRFGKTPIRIIDIRPGFVDTPMTAHLKKGPLFASAESVGDGIVRAIHSGKDIVYLPWFWRFILMIIKLIPEQIFKRLSL
ncbi:MAG: SDR family oxidoreductase [Bdellovibrionales bacterium]|nr:SDR family oxidoreductase [Bdellovibrionales bacterium]